MLQDTETQTLDGGLDIYHTGGKKQPFKRFIRLAFLGAQAPDDPDHVVLSCIDSRRLSSSSYVH